jgi:hypothetical protein
MARPEVTGRKSAGPSPIQRSKIIQPRPPPIARAGKSIAEFCQAYGISRSTWNNWQKAGLGPAVTQPVPGGRVLITAEAEDEWKRRHTAIAATIEAAE